MDKDRLIHSFAVAREMVELGKKLKLNESELQELFVLGYNHDIGYQFGNNENHNIIGGKILKECNYKYWKEVYFHGIPNTEYKSLYLNILNQADMSINKFGDKVEFNGRLEDIKLRYGQESIQYVNAKKLIREIEMEKNNE